MKKNNHKKESARTAVSVLINKKEGLKLKGEMHNSNGNRILSTLNLCQHFDAFNGNLPFDMVMPIVMFLDIQTNMQLQVTSKIWYSTLNNFNLDYWHSFSFQLHPNLPQQLDSDRFAKLKNAKFLLEYPRKGSKKTLKDQSLKRIKNICAQIYSDMTWKQKQLEYLSIEIPREYDMQSKFFNRTKQLKNLITNTISSQDNLQQLCLSNLGRLNILEFVKFEGLQSILIWGCSNMEDDVLLKISQNSPFLRELILDRPNVIDSSNWDYSNVGVSAILRNCAALECLEIGNDNYYNCNYCHYCHRNHYYYYYFNLS